MLRAYGPIVPPRKFERRPFWNCLWQEIINYNKTGDVRINVTLRRVHVTLVAVEKQ
jgi:hypothetical protein